MNNFSSNWIFEFAYLMQKKLNKNMFKRGWRGCTNKYLFKRMREEIKEIENAIKNNQPIKNVMNECVDVANFAMMIADNYEPD